MLCNNMKNIKYFGLVILVSLFFGQNALAADYQKTTVSSAKEVCVSYAAWGPASSGGMFSSCSNDDPSGSKIYKEGSSCGSGSEFVGTPTPATKIKCTTQSGEYCVPQQYITLYGDSPKQGLFVDDGCTQLKAGEKADKDYCCDCSAKGGDKTTVTVGFNDLPDCGTCIVKEGACEAIKDIKELQFTAKKILNPVGFVTGKEGVILLLSRAISFLMFPIGAIAMIMYIYAGFMWMSGSPDGITKAKSILGWTSFGIMMTLASYMLVKFVFSNLFG